MTPLTDAELADFAKFLPHLLECEGMYSEEQTRRLLWMAREYLRMKAEQEDRIADARFNGM